MRRETFPAKEREKKVHDHHFASCDQQTKSCNIITNRETEIQSLQKFHDHTHASLKPSLRKVQDSYTIQRVKLDKVSKITVELQEQDKMFEGCEQDLDKLQEEEYQEPHY